MAKKVYVRPTTTRTIVEFEGFFCASQKIEDSVIVDTKVEDYITIDDAEIKFE